MLPKPDKSKGENCFTGIIFRSAALMIFMLIFLVTNYTSYLQTTQFIANGSFLLLIANMLHYWWKESLYLEDTPLKESYLRLFHDDSVQSWICYILAFISSGFLRLCINVFALVNTIDTFLIVAQEVILLINYNHVQRAK